MTTSRGFEISAGVERHTFTHKEMVHTRRAEETLQGFHRDGEAECQEENTIYESGKDLCPVPAVGVPRIICALSGELGGEGYMRRVAMKCHKP